MSTRYVATINVPGYLPMDDEPAVFETAREAWQYLVSEVERSWDDFPEDENGACVEAHTQMHNINQDEAGSIYAPTPGYEGSHDLGLAYSVTAFEVDKSEEDVGLTDDLRIIRKYNDGEEQDSIYAGDDLADLQGMTGAEQDSVYAQDDLDDLKKWGES